VYIAPADRSTGEPEWRPFVEAQGFGHSSPRRGRDVPVVVPTQFVLDADRVLPAPAGRTRSSPPRRAAPRRPERGPVTVLHPLRVEAIDGEDPRSASRPPTTPRSRSWHRHGVERPTAIAEVLRAQLGASSRGHHRRPEMAHQPQLRAIRAITVAVDEVRAKFKYGGNVDAAHRAAVVERLRERGRR